MTPRDLAHHRLANQQITQSRCTTPGEVVAWLGAMQAQDYPGALWSIALRLPQATVADVERAITERTIVRTWPMRGTLHFVATADVRWMLELLTPRIVASRAGRHRELGLDRAVFTRSEKLIVKALQGGRQSSRAHLLTLLERHGIATAEQRGYVILWYLAHHGVLCFGAHEGKQPTFALLDEWVPAAKSRPREAALAELARRYFTSHGPATLRDFIWWTGLKVVDAKAGLALAGRELVKVAVDGVEYWMSPNSPPAPALPAPAAHLLPGFDEYLLGYTDRSAALAPRHAPKVVPGNNGVFKSTVVVDGQILGLWQRTVRKDSVIITTAPFGALSKRQTRALTHPATRYGHFHCRAAILRGGKLK